MDRQTERAVAALAADRRSSASEILRRELALLRDALRRAEVAAVGRGLAWRQPCMASIRNAVGTALTGSRGRSPGLKPSDTGTGSARPFRRRGLADRPWGWPSRRVVTCSSSRSVLVCLQALGERRAVRVACAEGRPAFEGRDMPWQTLPSRLTSSRTLDCSMGPLVVVGADGASSWVINKSGTGQLAAAASGLGVPVGGESEPEAERLARFETRVTRAPEGSSSPVSPS